MNDESKHYVDVWHLLPEGADQTVVSHAVNSFYLNSKAGKEDFDGLLLLFGRAYGDPLMAQETSDLLQPAFELTYKKIEWRGFAFEFLRRILKEARSQICQKSARSSNVRQQLVIIKASVPAIAASIGTWIGAKEPVSVGLATLALYLIIESTHGAFCHLTDEKVLSEIMQKSER